MEYFNSYIWPIITMIGGVVFSKIDYGKFFTSVKSKNENVIKRLRSDEIFRASYIAEILGNGFQLSILLVTFWSAFIAASLDKDFMMLLEKSTVLWLMVLALPIGIFYNGLLLNVRIRNLKKASQISQQGI